MGGPLWSPILRVVRPCGEYTQGTTGDHKGPPHIHPTTLAPTDGGEMVVSFALGDVYRVHKAPWPAECSTA